ncbi:MAG: hypothetical protein H2B03_04970 [Nitrosopumilaceae archaeon]|uniref:Uncharacterized protein n=3 Tax=Candidatus Nitrosomaritimum aestuariumsis TaxID=3342354 RepID=A0AC60WAN3_9ARCH|nr:hypothetical protein [Nitrosopumilaceae archaeon]MBA4463926.1 hypothetical protein [Nitrosopumilaceae archaeon]
MVRLFQNFCLIVLLPLVLSLSVTFFSQSHSEEFFCPSGEVEVIRVTNPNPICIDYNTADRWETLGIAEIVKIPKTNNISESNKFNEKQYSPIVSPDTFEPEIQRPSIPDDTSRAKSYLVTISGGELTQPILFQTFSKIEPGDKPHYVASFHEQGFDTFFYLESNPSLDKGEFYSLVAKTINPEKTPELFDASIDVLAGDNSVIVTLNYSKCKITNYTPYSQDYVLFYQYSDLINDEIRDRIVLYCSGMSMQVYDSENEKIIPNNSLPYSPSLQESASGYVVHFFGPDFDGLYTVETFSDFSPSVNLIETPFDVITIPGNPLDSDPQFFLESLPSKDKMILYEYFAKWVNPGQPPEDVNVSIDMVTGDGNILQRWNYVDCSLYDYTMNLEDSLLKFSYTGIQSPEIREKSEFQCNGMNLEVNGEKSIDKFPIRSSISNESKLISPKIPESKDRAKYFEINVFGGDLTKVHISDKIQKFEPIRRDRGPLTPLTHDKQYDFGFVLESLPQKEKALFYDFISRYINPGKTPEPFDVNIHTKNGDSNTLHILQYSNCDAVDFWWYLQQANWYYQFSGKEEDEIRERYIVYCEGFGIEFP